MLRDKKHLSAKRYGNNITCLLYAQLSVNLCDDYYSGSRCDKFGEKAGVQIEI